MKRIDDMLAELVALGESGKLPSWVSEPDPNKIDWRFGWSKVNANKKIVLMGKGETGYLAYLKSNKWAATRGVVLILSRFKCARCSGSAVDVHHKTYKRIGKESLLDLEPLCRACHESEHGGPVGGLMQKIIRGVVGVKQ